MPRFLLFLVTALLSTLLNAQSPASSAAAFIKTLDQQQITKAVFPFDTAERFRFAYVPLNDRKGISFNELNEGQRTAAMNLLKSCVTNETAARVSAIMQLDVILKKMESRSAEDHFRDPGKYFISIFGVPAAKGIWGWRLEGHHVAFHFSSEDNTLVSGTPGFMGSNPAIVPDGPEKGKEILKPEADGGFAALNALSETEKQKAIIATDAPADIVTAANRKAMIEHPAGIFYRDMNPSAQKKIMDLLSLYVHRYTKLFADDMLRQIKEAGYDNLQFAWAGATERLPGKPWYYRIQGPTIIIECDNTQNNANHMHTVVRDLKNDFGGDLLLEHYRQQH
ncbi:MAG: DUF3500 domain-containing protein [Bacteroidota bacterium]|nr:DUF3500 domain-containing protein [Bacteroidota bacterium]